ncbi:MAG TPA: YigZ family protein [Bacteroidetes bacterium]|nr:YigZ family protein [Bacteroidota bacterium]
MEDQYTSLKAASEGYYKEKGSRFYGFAWPVHSLEEVEAHLAAVSKKYYDARHVCYAYRFGVKGEPWRANDDGEPSHSAGDPILNELRSKGISDALVAVIRYFGGTKLGVGGLIRAYGTAAKEAIENGQIVEIVLTERLEIRFSYEFTSEVNRALHKLSLKPDASVYEADCWQAFDIRKTEVAKVAGVFRELGILVEKLDKK